MKFLETIFAVSFLFFSLSILISGMQEFWSMLINKRGRELKRSIQLFLKQDLRIPVNELYDQPRIALLKESPRYDSLRGRALKIINLFRREKYEHKFFPSYIKNQTFSKALIDTYLGSNNAVLDSTSDKEILSELLGMLLSCDKTNFRQYLELINLSELPDHIASVLINFQATSYDSTNFESDKNRLLSEIRGILNKRTDELEHFKDTFHLSKDNDLQSSVVGRALQDSSSIVEVESRINEMYDEYMNRVSGWYKRRAHFNITWMSIVVVVFTNINVLDMFQISNGMEQESMHRVISELSFSIPNWNIIKSNFIGWVITVMALSLGAPFWFDVLKKYIGVKTTGPQ